MNQTHSRDDDSPQIIEYTKPTSFRLLFVSLSLNPKNAHVLALRSLREQYGDGMVVDSIVDELAPRSTDTDVDHILGNTVPAIYGYYATLPQARTSPLPRAAGDLREDPDFLRQVEAQVSRLKFRSDRSAYGYRPSRRWATALLDRQLEYWATYLTVNQPTHVIFTSIPHLIGDYVLYRLCRLRGVPTLLLSPEKGGFARPRGAEVWHRTTRPPSIDYSRFFASTSIEEIGDWKPIAHSTHAAPLQRYTDQDQGDQSAVTASGNLLQSRNRVLEALDSIRDEWRRQPWHALVIVARSVRSTLQRLLWERHAEWVNPTGRCIVYFLAFQPEESTAPRAGRYLDQIHAVRELSQQMPSGWTIFVREHPDQSRRRYPRTWGYYRQLREIPGVSLASLRQDATEALENSSVAAAPGGSMAFQAWRALKPLILFGHIAIKRAPGVFFIERPGDVASAIARILRGDRHTAADVTAFETYLESCALPGDMGSRAYKRRSTIQTAAVSIAGAVSDFITRHPPTHAGGGRGDRGDGRA